MAVTALINKSLFEYDIDFSNGDEEFIFELKTDPALPAKIQFDSVGVVGGTPKVEIRESGYESATAEHWASLFDTEDKTIPAGESTQYVREPTTPYNLIKVKTSDTAGVTGTAKFVIRSGRG